LLSPRVNFFKSVNIWQSYKQEGRYLMRYLCLLEVRWPGAQGARHNHLLAGNTHTHPLKGPLSGTTRVSWYQKGKTNVDFTEARESEWQWHQLGHMQVCISLQTENHAWRFDRFTSTVVVTPPLKFSLQAGCPSCRPTNSVKALKAIPSCQ